jgi:hypothetical protein
MTPRRRKSTNRRTIPKPLGKHRLEALIEEAIIDAYGGSEQRVGFLTMLADGLAFPFKAEILGAPAIVEQVDLKWKR